MIATPKPHTIWVVVPRLSLSTICAIEEVALGCTVLQDGYHGTNPTATPPDITEYLAHRTRPKITERNPRKEPWFRQFEKRRRHQ